MEAQQFHRIILNSQNKFYFHWIHRNLKKKFEWRTQSEAQGTLKLFCKKLKFNDMNWGDWQEEK